jgi:hypothetical protein
VQRTAGSLRDLQAFSLLEVFSALRLLSAPAPRPPLPITCSVKGIEVMILGSDFFFFGLFF